jgi:hypothetical protein
MEPDDTSKEASFDMKQLATGLNEMRDSFVLLSTLIKDYRASVDWDFQGDGTYRAMKVVAKAARESQGSGHVLGLQNERQHAIAKFFGFHQIQNDAA